jgi:NTP pyrophosphatase (non-canonical NTP hydrolase)
MFAIGDSIWPGISKLNEEAGEVIQVIGKLMGTGGRTEHWDGAGDLKTRLQEEMGDLHGGHASSSMLQNGLDRKALDERSRKKLDLFIKWHQEQQFKDDP